VEQWIHTPIEDDAAFADEVKTVCDIYADAIERMRHYIELNQYHRTLKYFRKEAFALKK